MGIQHKPSERVQLRASVHSGSVVAGIQVQRETTFSSSSSFLFNLIDITKTLSHCYQVVGSKMPRYRLFGDTVDVAAMMNTTGEGESK